MKKVSPYRADSVHDNLRGGWHRQAMPRSRAAAKAKREAGALAR